MQKINAELAAHNIAIAFVQQYSKLLNTTSDFDLDSSAFYYFGGYQKVNTAAQIYANTYDSVHNYILRDNESLNQ